MNRNENSKLVSIGMADKAESQPLQADHRCASRNKSNGHIIPGITNFFKKCADGYICFLIPKKFREPPTPALPTGGGGVQTDHFSSQPVDSVYSKQFCNCSPPKLCMVLISLIEAIFFIYDELSSSGKIDAMPLMNILLFDPRKITEIWRFVTYMFVHIGYLHLIVNIVVQIMLGVPLEMFHGWWRILVIYLAGVASGSLAHSIIDPKSRLAGASAGVYAIITAHISSLIMNWDDMPWPAVHLAGMIFVIMGDFGYGIYEKYFGRMGSNVGYTAHLAGAVSGLLVGIYVVRNLNKKYREKIFWWTSVILYSVLVIFGIGYNVYVHSK